MFLWVKKLSNEVCCEETPKFIMTIDNLRSTQRAHLGPAHREGVSAKSISSGVWGQGGRVAPFRNRDDEANKTLRAEF